VIPEPRTPRLLYIDDDAGFARLVTRGLGRLGFEVVHAPDGPRGLDMLASELFDVVALDHFMPDLSGEQTLARILAMPDPPPVVYVTACDESLVAVAALKAGAADYVLKDVGESFSELLAAVLDQAIDNARLKANQERAHAEISAARERAEIMLKEVNHRVANSLTMVVSMAHLQASALQEGAARDAVTAFAKRVNAIAQVHKRLYTSHDVRTVALDVYLSELVHNLHDSIADAQTITGIVLDCCPLQISTDQAISVGVILSEMITNASKYAYAGEDKGVVRVSLSLEESGEQACLAVEDDGVGLACGTPTGTGLGGQIMEALAHGLGGELVIGTGQSGTRAILRFPVELGREAA
jgi:two-component sensor histidine kinase/CheY-like chemotaxis protein